LSAERLEERTLLAGDLLSSGISPWQNPYLPSDVNFDLETTALDALVLIQSLNQTGSRSLASADPGLAGAAGAVEGEDPANTQYMDVNGDSYLSPLDVLGVINTINNAEGEGSLLTFLHSITDLDGNALQDRDSDGTPEIIAGEEFLYQVRVRDSRSPRFGVFSGYTIVPVDFGLVTPAYQEVQSLAIDPTANGGSFTLQWNGSVSTEIDVGSDYQFDAQQQVWSPEAGLLSVSSSERAAIIQAAVESITGLDSSNVEVTQTAYLTYDITFTGNLANGNVAEMVPQEVAGKELRSGMDINGTGTDIPGSPPTAVVTVTERVAADPDSNLSFLSAANSASNLAIGEENRTYTFAFQGFLDKETAQTPATGAMNLGATARLAQVGQTFEIDWADGWTANSTHLFYAVRFTADNAGTLTLQVGPPDANDNFTPDEITLWPSPQAQQGQELNLFVNGQIDPGVEFPVALDLDIIELATAVDDNETVDEDSGVTNFDVLANDSVAEGTKQLGGIVTPPTNGQASVVGDQISYEPDLNYNNDGVQTDQIVYEMHNGQGNTDRATIFVTVDPVNDPPVNTVPGNQTMDEDAELTFNGNVSIADIDADGQDVEVTLTATSTLTLSRTDEVNFTAGGDGQSSMTIEGTVDEINRALNGMKYAPNPNFNGTGTVTIRTNDKGNTGPTSAEDIDSIVITVEPLNDAPVNTVPGTQTVASDSLPLNFGTNISVDDPLDIPYAPGGDVEVEVSLSLALPSTGTLTLGSTNNVTIEDGANGSAAVTIKGTTANVNAALNGLEYNNTELSAQDTLTVTTDDLGNEDKDGLSAALTDTDTVAINVVPPTRPFAAADLYDVNEDSGDTEFTVLVNDFNYDSQMGGANLNITAVTQPAVGGSVANNGTSVTFTAADNYAGTTTFTYTIEDTSNAGDGPSTGQVTVDVMAINDDPTLDLIPDPPAVLEDTPQTVNLMGISAGPLEDQALTVTATSNNTGLIPNPTVNYTSPGATGSVSYTPVLNQNGGPVTMTVTVTDAGLDGISGNADDASTSQSFTVNVTAVNDAPEFMAPDTRSVAEDNTLTFTGVDIVSLDDVEDDNLTVTITPTNGTVSLTTVSGTESEVNAALAGLTYTPTADYNGPASITLDVVDDGVPPATADHTITVTVSEVNDKPTAVDDNPGFTTNEETSKTIAIADLISNDLKGPANESGQTLTIVDVNVDPQYGTATLNGSVVFNPADNFVGDAILTYTVQDNGTTNGSADPLTDEGEFTVTVTGLNDPPVNDLPPNQTTDEDTPFTFSVTNVIPNEITISDADAGSNPVQTTVSVDKGATLTLPNGTPMASIVLTDTVIDINTSLEGMTFTPPTGFNSNVDGLITLTITTNDQGHSEGIDNSQVGSALEDADTITIEVVDRNDDPIPQDDNVTMAEGGGTLTIDDAVIIGNDSAGPNEDNNQTLTIIGHDSTTTRGGTVTRDPGGTFRYTPPDIDFNTVDDPPVDTFTYTIEDDGTTLGSPDPKTAVGEVTVTVTEVNDDPIADDDLRLIDPNPSVGQQFTFSASEFLANDETGPANESGQTLKIVDVSNSAMGVNVELNGTDIIYTVPAGFDVDHMDTFTVTIEDDGTTNGADDFKRDTSVVTVRDVVPSYVTGHVYNDLAGDGRMNGIDPGIGGVTVKLQGQSLVPNSAPVDLETQTDENGYYYFAGVLPNLDGYRYTITHVHPNHFSQGQASAQSARNDLNDQHEASDVIVDSNTITVALPLLGYQDGGNHYNNFGKMGPNPEWSSVDNGDLLYSQGGGNETTVELGLMFEVDEFGNVKWWSGDWRGYAPGTASPSGGYENGAVSTTNGRSMRITDTTNGQVHLINLGDRARWRTSGTSTIIHVYGGPDDFGLDVYSAANPGGEGEAITEDQTIEMLAAAGDPAQYAAAADAAFAEMSA